MQFISSSNSSSLYSQIHPMIFIYISWFIWNTQNTFQAQVYVQLSHKFTSIFFIQKQHIC